MRIHIDMTIAWNVDTYRHDYCLKCGYIWTQIRFDNKHYPKNIS